MDEVTTDLARYRAPGALVRKRPADITPARPRERMVAGYLHKHTLLAEAKRRERAGMVRLCQDRPIWSAERGQWEITVERLRPLPPRWVKPTIITATLCLALGAFGALGLWLYATLSALPGALLLLLVLAVFAGGTAAGQWQGRRGVTEVLVSVLVRVR